MKNIIDQELCKPCNLCIVICPNRIIRTTESGSVDFRPDRIEICSQCGHCMAICPTKAISIENLSYKKDFFEIEKHVVTDVSFYNFLSARRTCRVFKDIPVPKEILQKIIEMISLAPYGVSKNSVEISIVQNRSTIEKALPYFSEFYDNVGKWMKQPFMHFMMKMKLSPEKFNTIKNHLMPNITKGLYDIKNGEDGITRKAPALIIFHADKRSESHTDDALIYLTYGFLAAHSLGLGATVIGLIPSAINKVQKLKEIFQIPAKNEAIASMILGYPKYKFKRGIKHERTKINWV